MADIAINCDVKAIVENQIRLAVAETLSRSPEALVESIVKGALQQKADTYDRRTMLQKALDEMIRDQAIAALKQWCADNAPMIQKLVLAEIRKKDGLAKQVADALVAAIGKSMTVHVQVGERG